jgi:hypothetical protein
MPMLFLEEHDKKNVPTATNFKRGRRQTDASYCGCNSSRLCSNHSENRIKKTTRAWYILEEVESEQFSQLRDIADSSTTHNSY